jgi:LmeA-like phospholipid-binding
MNFIATLLSVLIALINPIGFGTEQIAAQQIRQRLHQVEQLNVRIDNAPNYQIINGKIDKVRIAGKGIFPIADFRIDTLEIETDPIALQGLKAKLDQPLQAGIKVVLKAADMNKALASPIVLQRLRNIGINAIGSSSAASQVAKYELLNPHVDFLADRRFQIAVDLKEQGQPEVLKLKIDTGIEIVKGRLIQLTDTKITANNQAVYAPLAKRLIAGVNQELDLDRLETRQITARILDFNSTNEQLSIATFVQLRPQP